jgi:biopolymer transport protein TolR
MPATVARRGTRRRSVAEINMVPFIDVMLVLLIIFMVTAPLLTPGLVELPSVGRAAPAPQRVVEVLVLADAALAVKPRSAAPEQAERVELRRLADKVKALQGGDAAQPVVISADRKVPYERVIEVLDALKRAGIGRVGLAVRSES